MARLPTGPLAAIGLIGGFALATLSGSRPLGGVLLLAAGGACGAIWLHRLPARTALALGGAYLIAFAASHGLGLLVGAWPSVLLVSAAMVGICLRWADRTEPAEMGSLPGR